MLQVSEMYTEQSWHAFLDDIIERCGVSSERKQDRSRKREREILRAAIRTFARDGVSRARIGDIAAEAGMPISTIYEYYSGKEEIAHLIPVAHLRMFFAEYKEQILSKPTAYECLWLYLYLAADFARRNPDWARALYLEIWPSVTVSESDVRDCFDDYVRIIVYLLEMGEERGEWPTGPDHYETAAILVGGINQLIITWALYRQPRDINRAARSLLNRAMLLLNPRNPVEL